MTKPARYQRGIPAINYEIATLLTIPLISANSCQ